MRHESWVGLAALGASCGWDEAMRRVEMKVGRVEVSEVGAAAGWAARRGEGR